MLITIRNEQLTVTVDSVGAGFHSIRREGIEYLWQGDAKYWKRRDANLFPYVGRMTNGKYTYKGREYPMTIHGFCIGTEFDVEEQSSGTVTLLLRANEATRAVYPFEFAFRVRYELSGSSIIKTCTVENLDSKTVLFGIGGHPGFNTPINGEGNFTDWYMQFDADCDPFRVEFNTESCRISGVTTRYPLEDMNRMPLNHEMFANDAVVLGDVPRGVTLASDKSSHSVHVSFPGMEYVGFWQAHITDAAYVCIEPWASLPSHHEYVEDLENQAHIIHLPVGQTYKNVMAVDIK